MGGACTEIVPEVTAPQEYVVVAPLPAPPAWVRITSYAVGLGPPVGAVNVSDSSTWPPT